MTLVTTYVAIGCIYCLLAYILGVMVVYDNRFLHMGYVLVFALVVGLLWLPLLVIWFVYYPINKFTQIDKD